MAKIIKFRSKSGANVKPNTANLSDTQRIDYRDKIRGHRFMVFYRTVLIFALLAAALLVTNLISKSKVYTDCMIVSSTENMIVESATIMNFDGAILSYSKDGANCSNIKGEAIWNITYAMQNPMVSINGSVVAIGDSNARTIYIMNTEGTLGQITTTMPIYKFAVAETGVVAVVLNDTDVTWIYLYDSMGNTLAYFKTTMQQSGYPMDLTISANGQLVGISFLYVNSGEMKTRVAFYNFGDVGKNETDNYVSGYDYSGTVAPVIRFMNGKTAFAVADDRLMIYSGNQKPVSAAEHFINEEVQSVYYSDEYIGLVFMSNSADYRYRLEMYDVSGNQVNTLEFNLDYSDIVIHGKNFYIYNESRCIIGRVGGGVKYDGALGKSASLLIPTDSPSKLTAVSRESIDKLELQ